MKNFLKISFLSLTIFFTACNQLHIENIAEIHGYYATDDNKFIVSFLRNILLEEVPEVLRIVRSIIWR